MTSKSQNLEKEMLLAVENMIIDTYRTPRQMVDLLAAYGYIGQERAKKAVCLMAYRHLNRLKKIYLDNISRQELPAKENYLLMGPTGCGKTYLIELLFQRILKIPTVIVDVTNFSETGYVGQDVNTILTRLIHVAEESWQASFGIVCLDEFDKLASGQNNAVFSGAGTTKDVTGAGVQRELLKMFEASEVDVPYDISHSTYSERITFNTENVPFIACGAFSGFKNMLYAKEQNIGFGRTKSGQKCGISTGFTKDDIEKAVNFEAYGLMPELMGRFTRIVPFDSLSAKNLKQILHKNTIEKYRKELKLDDIELRIEDSVYDLIVEKSIEKETGARGLKSYIVEYLEDACFEAYSSDCKLIRLFTKAQNIQWELG